MPRMYVCISLRLVLLLYRSLGQHAHLSAVMVMMNDADGDSWLAIMHSRLEKAREAASQREITPGHYQEVDKAISEALGQLSFLRRSGNSNSNNNNNDNQLQWAKPLDRPQHVEDLASAHSQGIKRFRAMVEEHNGPLENIMLEPSKRSELAGIFEGAGEGKLRQLLTDMQRARDVSRVKRYRGSEALFSPLHSSYVPAPCTPLIIHYFQFA